MKASDLFVRCLEAEGVEMIFGVPGEENADFMISLMDSHIEFVLCRHEQAAAFMADGYGRLTGKSGVCLATLGPGVTNLVTGLADANMEISKDMEALFLAIKEITGTVGPDMMEEDPLTSMMLPFFPKKDDDLVN